MEIPQEIFYGGMGAMSVGIVTLFKQQTDSRLKCEQSNAKMFDKIELLRGEVGFLKGVLEALKGVYSNATIEEMNKRLASMPLQPDEKPAETG